MKTSPHSITASAGSRYGGTFYILHSNHGFSLIGVMLASTLFAIIAMAFVGAIIYGQQSAALVGNRARAVFLAEEGLEAARNIRDDDFALLVDGTYGIASDGSTLNFSGPKDTTGVFDRTVQISTVDSNTKNIASTVAWLQTPTKFNSISLNTHLANWKILSGPVENPYLVINFSEAKWTGGNDHELKGLTMANTGPSDIVVDKMTVSWTAKNRKIICMDFEGSGHIWKWDKEGTPDGKQLSGTELDVENYTLKQSATKKIEHIKFEGNMQDSEITITFTFLDGSQKTVIFTPANA